MSSSSALLGLGLVLELELELGLGLELELVLELELELALELELELELVRELAQELPQHGHQGCASRHKWCKIARHCHSGRCRRCTPT